MLGAESVVLNLARLSRDFGYRSIVAVPWENGLPEPQLLTRCHEAGVATLPLHCQTQFSLSPFMALRRAVVSEDVTLVHAHGYREDAYALAAAQGRPLVATNHLWKRTSPRLRLYAHLDGRLLRQFDEVVAVSQPILNEMADLQIGRLSHVFNGVDVDGLLQQPEDSGLAELYAPGLPVALTVSSLTTEKGLDMAIAAVSALRREGTRVALGIVGSGPEESSLRRQVREDGLEGQVKFLGRRSDVGSLLKAAEIFLLPSRNEGLPIALLEGMACSCAVAATRVGDVSAAVDDGESGLLCLPNVPSMTDALRRLVNDTGLRTKLSRRAHEVVSAKFSARAMARGYAAVYDRALSRKG